MRKYSWIIPAIAFSGSLAGVMSAKERGCDSMAVFWGVMSIALFILTTHVGSEETQH
jgi:hypothetical protein